MHQPGDGYTLFIGPETTFIVNPRFTPSCATSSPTSPRSPVSCKSIMR